MRTILDNKIRQRDDFLEKNAGGEDYFQDEKMRIIRSLPALSELRNNERAITVNDDEEPKAESKPVAKVESVPVPTPAAAASPAATPSPLPEASPSAGATATGSL